MVPLLLQFASQGITIIANGALPKTTIKPPSISEAMKEQTLGTNMMAAAIDWAERATKSSPQWEQLDTTKIAAGGQSCGGFEAILMAHDKRVTTIGIFNSGGVISKKGGISKWMNGLMPIPNKGVLPNGSQFNVPVFFFLGGSSDIASAKVCFPASLRW
jgi:dienelactone hydrolase